MPVVRKKRPTAGGPIHGGSKLGDVNQDGIIKGLDVDPFVDVLLSGRLDVAADMNGDGVVNGFDVEPFVVAVVGGAEPVPEPSTLLYALLVLVGQGTTFRWGLPSRLRGRLRYPWRPNSSFPPHHWSKCRSCPINDCFQRASCRHIRQ
jgi:hypothetical protein